MDQHQRNHLIYFANKVKQDAQRKAEIKLNLELKNHEKPTLLGIKPNIHHSDILVYCKYCFQFHSHNDNVGVQVAGCSEKLDSPYSKTGYSIKLIDNSSPDADRVFSAMLRTIQELVEMVYDISHRNENSDLK